MVALTFRKEVRQRTKTKIVLIYPTKALAQDQFKRIVEYLSQLNEKLNLGQPWSWFLIPRLELLVDAGILVKDQPDQLTGYSLTLSGRRLQELTKQGVIGKDLYKYYFSVCKNEQPKNQQFFITWEELREDVLKVASELKSPLGYYPVFETAAVICLTKLETARKADMWEIPDIESTIHQAGVGKGAPLILGIDKMGRIYNFKFRK